MNTAKSLIGAPTMPSVLFPQHPARPETVIPFAELVQRTGARRLWMGQSLGTETHQTLAYVAGMGLHVPVGTSVTLMALRHPFEAALQARSLAMLTRQPLVAGYGVGAPSFVRALEGANYPSPRTAAHEYLTTVRALLDGKTVDHNGRYHVLHGGLPPAAHSSIEVGLGVLRPRMAHTAGAVADVAITWMTPPHYVQERLVPALEAGAAGQRRPPRVATVVHVAVARQGRDLRRLAQVAAMGHLMTEHYTSMLRQAGVTADPADPVAGARALVEAGIFVNGKPDEIAMEIDRYRQAGVDEVILNPAGVLLDQGADAALSDLEEILAAVRAQP